MDSNTPQELDLKEFEFNKDKNLFLAIHGVKGGITVHGQKNNQNQWSLDVVIEDTYDFEFKSHKSIEYTEARILNELASILQMIGAVRTYNVQLNFSDLRS